MSDRDEQAPPHQVSPARVSRPPGVFTLAKRTFAEISRDRIPLVAAGVTFFILLAMFPAIGSAVSFYGLFAHRSSIGQIVQTVSPWLPGGAVTVLGNELRRLTAEKPAKLDLALFIGAAVALWIASGGVKALIEALNVAFETTETRGFFKLSGDALLFTAVGIVAAALAVFVAVAAPAVLAHVPHSQELEPAFAILRWPGAFIVTALVFRLVYRIGPDRKERDRSWITWGSAIAALLWIGGTLLFGWYVRNFGSYDRTYGSLGAVVGFLTWIWISLMILLAGAELDCEIARLRRG
ncbi:MAG: YihY/virulence factor BrkB family protein [Rhizomicrobium sp.]